MVILKTENHELRTNLKTLTDEVKKLKAELGEANASKDADIRARLYPIIQNSIPTITRIELDEMTPKELAAFAQTLSRVDKKESPGKPNLVIASADAVSDMHVTLDRMPNMYGKSREEILKQVGV
jgi:predicted RNase H-like nuclease (RuvC/YqgF family)